MVTLGDFSTSPARTGNNRFFGSVLLKAAPAAPAPTNDIDGFQCLLCANKYTYIHVCLVPGTCACVSCSVVCSNTSALSNGCSPHVPGLVRVQQ